MFTAVWLVIKGFASGIAGFFMDLPTPVKVGLAALLVLVGSNWYTAHSVRAEVTTAITAKYEKQLETTRLTHEAARFLQAMGEDALLADVQGKLEASRKEKARVTIITKKVKEYVTEKADAMCHLTDGFVWFHNMPLASGSAPVAEFPEGSPGNVDAPATVKISTASRTIADNYVECQERGRLLALWQYWYPHEKQLYETAQKLIIEPAP